MAKILCITSGLTGILNASYELVNRLRADGHELLYASPRSIGTEVRRQSIKYAQLPMIEAQTKISIPSFSGPFKKISRWLYKIRNASSLQAQELEKLAPKEFLHLVQRESPDLLIIDIELHEYILASYNSNIPVILMSQWFSLWKRDGLPYLLHDIVPGKGWKGSKMGMALDWQKVRINRWWTFLRQRIYSVSTDRRSLLLKYAEEVGFPMAYLKENNWPGPFTYDQLPVIGMVAQELEFPHTPRPHLHYVGPMVAAHRQELAANEKFTHQLTSIIKTKESTKAKLIYCSVSTLSPGDRDFIDRLITAVASQKKWLLIIGMGGLIEDTAFENLPSNIFAFSYIPQLKVLEVADCSINHGGIHTINECIHYRVPMLVYSGKRSDQNGCAARIAYHKLGIMADKDIDSPNDILIKIEQVMSDMTYQNNVNAMHLKCSAYRKTKKLEFVINEMLSTTQDYQEKISI